jgi:hypothetical protein
MATRKIPVGNKGVRKVGDDLVTACESIGPAIIDLVSAGLTPSRAAECCGLHKSTVSKWITRGLAEQVNIDKGLEPDRKEKPYFDFVNGLIKAESTAQAALVMSWMKEARQGDWKAAERFLARRWPQEWGDNNTVRLEVTNGMGMGAQEPQKIELTKQEDEDRKRAILSALVEAGDLPSNVLNAWDGNKDDDIIDAEVIDVEVVDEQ